MAAGNFDWPMEGSTGASRFEQGRPTEFGILVSAVWALCTETWQIWHFPRQSRCITQADSPTCALHRSLTPGLLRSAVPCPYFPPQQDSVFSSSPTGEYLSGIWLLDGELQLRGLRL